MLELKRNRRLSLTLGEDEETSMNSVAQTATSSCASLIALLEAI